MASSDRPESESPSESKASAGEVSDVFFSPDPEKKLEAPKPEEDGEVMKTRPGGLARPHSSPHLGASKGKYDGCNTLSDVTHVLFSVSMNEKASGESSAKLVPSQERPPVAQEEETKPALPNDDEEPKSLPNRKTLQGERKGRPAPTRQANSRQLVAKRDREEQDEDVLKPKPQQERPAPTRQANSRQLVAKRDREVIEKMDKVGGEAKVSSKQERNTVAGPARASGTQKLLAKFITYNDQRESTASAALPPVPPRNAAAANRQYAQLPQHSPKGTKRMPSLTSARQRESTLSTRTNTSLEVPEICLIRNDRHVSDLHTPESQRQTGLLKNLKGNKQSSPSESASNRPTVRNILPLVFDILRIFVIMFSTASMVSRAFISLAGKMSILWYISKNPILFVVQGYISVFHNVFMTIELDLGVPIVLPKGSLDNWLQKGFLISFIGMLELLMSNNQSLDGLVDELQGGGLSDRSVNMQVAFTVLGISSRGTIACGVVYILLGLFGLTGETRRQLAHRAVGLVKTPTRASV